MSNRKKYYAVFTKFDDSVEVIFPDFEGCYAFGFDLADAYKMAFDELFYHLPKVEQNQTKKPSSYEDIKKQYSSDNQVILPFHVDAKGVPFYNS